MFKNLKRYLNFQETKWGHHKLMCFSHQIRFFKLEIASQNIPNLGGKFSYLNCEMNPGEYATLLSPSKQGEVANLTERKTRTPILVTKEFRPTF